MRPLSFVVFLSFYFLFITIFFTFQFTYTWMMVKLMPLKNVTGAVFEKL